MTVTAEELKDLKADKVVDARGTSCPGPILAAKKGIVDVKVGEIMAVLATDSGTKKTCRLGRTRWATSSSA